MSAQMHFLLLLFALNLHSSYQCPIGGDLEDLKAKYKSGNPDRLSIPITLETIRLKLSETGIFDERTVELNDREKKELKKLFDTIEIMTTSRNRQPDSVQNLFSSLRMVERVIKKQLKERQISETLAAKFHWEKLSGRHRRERPMYYVDKNTKMRVFYYHI